MTSRLMFVLIAAAFLVNSCASSRVDEKNILSVEYVKHNSVQLNGGHYVVVDGFMKPMSGAYFLYPNADAAKNDDYSSGLDVVLSRTYIPKFEKDKFDNGNCATVGGAFRAFDRNTVGTGYFRSKVGFLVATSIVVHPCAPNS